MKKQNGFTLIELVVVIIILGILAVTAAPKFINLQGDARESSLQGMKGAIQGANSLVFSKAAISGGEKRAKAYWTGDATDSADEKGGVDIGTGTKAKTNFGYLQGLQAELENAIDVDFNIGTSATDPTIATDNNADWIIFVDSGVATIWQTGAPATCRFNYTESTAEGAIPQFSAMPEASSC
ncbi:type II secretion system protein [Shewanella psychropiezotolerans]|uniref:Type II secretion system protein n=1 Tax=Shewanella psychropiezotolerans TaxID=2593655 RepID=A0ABX5WSZ8_9GAMM|nr:MULTISPECIES: prepilin-type N-terminal cleavage/methylation domain-containing protein [Shewanella]MPY25886.1 type II secretion system protein [Shewanella sp. YLB-07]QDO82214.1 type II secretion system protein [Shewanella psychropiezotolerans]